MIETREEQEMELQIYDETASAVERCQSLGIQVGLTCDAITVIWWRFEDIVEALEKIGPPMTIHAPENARIHKIPPLKRAQWCYDEARKELWMAEELLMKLAFNSYTEDEQKFLAKLVREYQRGVLYSCAHIVYHLGVESARAQLENFTVEGINKRFGREVM